jgi:hypothetical protein
VHPLITESMKKAAVVWLSDLDGPGAVAGGRPVAAWCTWIGEALYIVSGPGEQPAPGLAGATRATVTGRGDNGARIIAWSASVARLEPGTEEWDQVAPTLAGKRLNLPADEDTPARWATTCEVSRLTPTAAEDADPGANLPEESLAAPPPGSPAARRTGIPFHLHRVRRRKKKKEK